MTLTIILFLVVMLGFVMISYALNRDRYSNREDALKSGKDTSHDKAK